MGKLKTRKSLSKRVTLSGTKSNRWGKAAKMVRKTAGQNHFNARDVGAVTSSKRRSQNVTGQLKKNIKRLLPYS